MFSAMRGLPGYGDRSRKRDMDSDLVESLEMVRVAGVLDDKTEEKRC